MLLKHRTVKLVKRLPSSQAKGTNSTSFLTTCCDSVVDCFLFIVTPIVGVCNCSMFCCTLLFVHSSFAHHCWERELVALLSLSSWFLVMVVWIFLAVPWVCLRFLIVFFS